MEVLTFLLKDERFAIDIKLIDTIENKMPLTPVPKSKAYVKGLVNLRGSVLPVIDINMVLDSKNINTEFQKLVIVNLDTGKIALAVNDIDEVLIIEDKDIELVSRENNISVINVESQIMTLITVEDLNKI